LPALSSRKFLTAEDFPRWKPEILQRGSSQGVCHNVPGKDLEGKWGLRKHWYTLALRCYLATP
jgi:hypothetical protein